MKTMAVFLGLMVTGSLVVMLYLWSGESLIVLIFSLVTILVGLWLFQQRPWEAKRRSTTPDADQLDETDGHAFDSNSPEVSITDDSNNRNFAGHNAIGGPDSNGGGVSSLVIERSKEFAELQESSYSQFANCSGEQSPVAVESQPPEPVQPEVVFGGTALEDSPGEQDEPLLDGEKAKPLAVAAGKLRERIFGRKTAVFDLEDEQNEDANWWDDHLEAEQNRTRKVDEATEGRKIPNPVGESNQNGRIPAGNEMRATGKTEVPLPPSPDSVIQPMTPGGGYRHPNPRTDTVQLRKITVDASEPSRKPALPAEDLTPTPRSGPKAEVNQSAGYGMRALSGGDRSAPGRTSTPSQPDPNPATPQPSLENVATEIRPARAQYDVTCDKKGISGVPENQQAPQLWAWHQIDDMALDVHPSTGLMTLRLGSPNLRDPSEPAYDWIEFGPEQDPDQVMDEARAGWRVSKIPRSQYYRLSPQERTLQMITFLTSSEIQCLNEGDEPHAVFDGIRAELISSGGLTQLSRNARLSDVLSQFGQLISDNKIEPFTGAEVAELESLGHTSTLPELYWSLDWFMEQRGKRIAFVDERRRDYLFGLIPAHLADHWDGQTVGGGAATVILDIP